MNLDVLKRRFANQKVLLIGDTIIDDHIKCEPLGLSLETPTIVCKAKSSMEQAGGAALVARNLEALGVRLIFTTLCGEDNWVLEQGFKDWSVVHDISRPTPRKSRFWANGYKLLQVDYIDNSDIGEQAQQTLTRMLENSVPWADIVVVADYRHGMIPDSMANWITSFCADHSKPVYVDSQISHRESNHYQYTGAATFCLSEKEAKAIDPLFDARVGDFSRLARTLACNSIAVKLGDKGSLTCVWGEKIRVQAKNIKPVDVCGAGDAFLAALAAYGSDPIGKEALEFANLWAAGACMTEGSGVMTWSQFEQFIKN